MSALAIARYPRASVSSYRRRVQRAWRRLAEVLSIATAPPLAGEFAAWARPWTIRFLATMTVVYGGVVLLALWPVDWLTVEDPRERAAFSVLRLSNAAVCAVAGAGLLVPAVRERVQAWAGLTTVAVSAVGAWTASALPHDPFYWPGLLAPLSCMILIVPLGERCAWTVVVSLAHNVAWYGHHPEALADPATMPTFGLYATSTLLGVFGGHAVTFFAWHVFLGRREIERQRGELATFNDRLAREVDEKTAEVRRLAERVQRIHEDERRRLAAELHDELGQSLTALRLETAMLERDADPKKSAAALHAQIDELFESVRFLVGSLRPKALDEGLAPACEWLVDRFATRTGAAIHADIDEVDGPGDAESLTVFRVLQEALTNVARHAEASRVDVSLRRDDEGALVLRIRDDGVGFDPDARAEGHGVSAMRERAMVIGAALSIARQEPGTVVTLRIPRAAEDQEASA